MKVFKILALSVISAASASAYWTYTNYQEHSPNVIIKREYIPSYVQVIRYDNNSVVRVWYRFYVENKEYSHSNVWLSKSKHCTDLSIDKEQKYPITVEKTITRGNDVEYNIARGELYNMWCR